MYDTFHKCPLALQSLAWVHTHPHSIPLYPVQQIQFTKISFSHLTVGVWCASDTGSVRVSQVSAAVWVAGAQEPPSSLKTWNWKKTKWWAFGNAPDQGAFQTISVPICVSNLHILASRICATGRRKAAVFFLLLDFLLSLTLFTCFLSSITDQVLCTQLNEDVQKQNQVYSHFAHLLLSIRQEIPGFSSWRFFSQFLSPDILKREIWVNFMPHGWQMVDVGRDSQCE